MSRYVRFLSIISHNTPNFQYSFIEIRTLRTIRAHVPCFFQKPDFRHYNTGAVQELYK